jgi:hypothetical protein
MQKGWHTATKPSILYIRIGIVPHHFGGLGFAPGVPDPLLDPQHCTETRCIEI